MGGKTKQTQRTKNNSKPANSERSALLLGNTLQNRLTFDQGKQGFGSVLDAFSDENLKDLAPEFQVVFRKMNKKDVITKTKALIEFSDLLKTDVADDVLQLILPIWPRYYCNLATDVDHKVREAAQQAHAKFTAQCGKTIAPYLKQLAPIWISSQNDPYAPAASVAIASLANLFPPHKIGEVLIFCEKEIFDFIENNLTVSDSNGKDSSQNDKENKYQRSVICSLCMYSFYLKTVTGDHVQKKLEINKNILKNATFWSYSKHTSSTVRAAWFETLSIILNMIPSALEVTDYHKILTCICKILLSETESTVLKHLWSCLLLITSNNQNRHVTYKDIEQSFLPKLMKILSNCGDGNAGTIYPHMLPLLNNLSSIIPNDKLISFNLKFFDNFKIGLQKSSNVKLDVIAIATGYYECLRYVIRQIEKRKIISNDDVATDLTGFCIQLIDDHVLNVIDQCFTGQVSLSVKNVQIFIQIIQMFEHFSRHAEQCPLYQIIFKIIWSKMYPIFEGSLNNESITVVLHMHETFIKLINKCPTERKYVKFANQTENDRGLEKSSQLKSIDYGQEFNEFLINLTNLYVKRAEQPANRNSFIEIILTIIKLHRNQSIMNSLLTENDGMEFLFDWLTDENIKKSNLIDLILLCYQYEPEMKIISIFNRLLQNCNYDSYEMILKRILNDQFYSSDIQQKLMSMVSVKDCILRCVDDIGHGIINNNLNILSIYFKSNLFERNLSNEIIEQLIKCESKEIIPLLIDMAPVIMNNVENEKFRISYFAKLFSVYIENSDMNCLNRNIESRLLHCINNIIDNGKVYGSKELTITACIQIAINYVLKDLDLSIIKIERVSKTIQELFVSPILESAPVLEKEINLDRLFKTIETISYTNFSNQFNFIEYMCIYEHILNGSVVVTDIFERTEPKLDDVKSINSIFGLALLKLNILMSTILIEDTNLVSECIITRLEHDDEAVTEIVKETIEKKFYNENIFTEGMVSLLGQSLYIGHLGDTIKQSFTINNINTEIIMKILSGLENVLRKLPEEYGKFFFNHLFKLTKTSKLWTSTLVYLINLSEYKCIDPLQMLCQDMFVKGWNNYQDEKKLNNEQNLIADQISDILSVFSSKMTPRSLPDVKDLMNENNFQFDDLSLMIVLRCYIKNNFSSNFNSIDDKIIIDNSIKLIEKIIGVHKGDKEYLLYNRSLQDIPAKQIIFIGELAHLLSEIINSFPIESFLRIWDFVCIAISSWVLTVSKNSQLYRTRPISIFITSIYRLFGSISRFTLRQSVKSSTRLTDNAIDEWNNLFAKDVNQILMQCYCKIVSDYGDEDILSGYFIETISDEIKNIQFKYMFGNKNPNDVNNLKLANEQFEFGLRAICHPNRRIQVTGTIIIKNISPGYLQYDKESLNYDGDGSEQEKSVRKHFLIMFGEKMTSLTNIVQGFANGFSSKTNNTEELIDISDEVLFSYFLLWDSILFICSEANPELRATYVSYIKEMHFEEVLLPSLFQLMPAEIFRNQDNRTNIPTIFNSLFTSKINLLTIPNAHYACYLYIQSLRHIPALVRKWWNNLAPKQKTIVDKITTNHVTQLLCQEELKTITSLHEQQDNIHIRVHITTREIYATYSLDDARVELVIVLPNNYPLGVVKVESGSQIDGKMKSHVMVMQMTIFLTHQNGSIRDGLLLWKRNLDKQFQGVEECCVCYSILHQETGQIPKRSCKTCKKKFHGSCLYKWFSTSNKSTCPICRNLF